MLNRKTLIIGGLINIFLATCIRYGTGSNATEMLTVGFVLFWIGIAVNKKK